MDCTMDEGEPEYTVSYRYYEQTGYFQKKYININSYNEGKIEPFGKQMFPEYLRRHPNSYSKLPT